MEPPKDEFVAKATAHHRGGAGSHKDSRKKRRRTRKADRLAHIKDEEE